MAWLALVVDWQGADRFDAIRALTQTEPWHVASERGRSGIAHWAVSRGAPDVRAPAIEHDGLVVLLDGRLDNQRELSRSLEGSSDLSPEGALARGYRRW